MPEKDDFLSEPPAPDGWRQQAEDLATREGVERIDLRRLGED